MLFIHTSVQEELGYHVDIVGSRGSRCIVCSLNVQHAFDVEGLALAGTEDHFQPMDSCLCKA